MKQQIIAAMFDKKKKTLTVVSGWTASRFYRLPDKTGLIDKLNYDLFSQRFCSFSLAIIHLLSHYYHLVDIIMLILHTTLILYVLVLTIRGETYSLKLDFLILFFFLFIITFMHVYTVKFIK